MLVKMWGGKVILYKLVPSVWKILNCKYGSGYINICICQNTENMTYKEKIFYLFKKQLPFD